MSLPDSYLTNQELHYFMEKSLLMSKLQLVNYFSSIFFYIHSILREN